MGDSGIKPKKIEVLNSILGFIFGFKNTKGEVLSHWIAFADGFTYSPRAFYDAVEKELDKRKFPLMETSRVEFAQGGWLSQKRLYLRMMRERIALDVCASPFGNSYFFSCRTVYIPALIRLWHILAVLFVFGIVGLILIIPLGFLYTIIAQIALGFALGFVLHNTAAMGASDLDTFLLKIPALGIIYERAFREETYYRMDTRLVYVKKVPELVERLAEEVTGAKGLKLVEQFQSTPVFGDLYKPTPPKKQPDEKQ
jgi:hypothetical protein